MSKTKTKRRSRTKRSVQIFRFKVWLISGMVTEQFVKENPEVYRVIELRGDQTLDDLHRAIFDAFDREEEHLYEFQVGGKKPMDERARRYVHEFLAKDWWDSEPPAGIASRTALDQLGLKRGNVFYYWFDFGDDWWHKIRVLTIQQQQIERGEKFPRLIEQVGQSPPQYPEWDEDEYDDYDEDEE